MAVPLTPSRALPYFDARGPPRRFFDKSPALALPPFPFLVLLGFPRRERLRSTTFFLACSHPPFRYPLSFNFFLQRHEDTRLFFFPIHLTRAPPPRHPLRFHPPIPHRHWQSMTNFFILGPGSAVFFPPVFLLVFRAPPRRFPLRSFRMVPFCLSYWGLSPFRS